MSADILLVTAILVVIWIGIFSFLWNLDRKVRKLESDIHADRDGK